MTPEKIIANTTGYAIVHPEDSNHPNWVEMDYFSDRRRLSDEDMKRYRPGCTRMKVKLIPIEDDR